MALAANLAGCLFPGKPLVEGTGSLYNQHILAGQLGLPWEETYFTRARDLAGRLARLPGSPVPPAPGSHAPCLRQPAFQHRGYGEGRLCNHLAPVCDNPDHQSAKRSHLRLPGLLLHCVPPLLPQWHLLLRRGPAHGSLPRHFYKATWCSCCVPTSTTQPAPTSWPSSTE